jgi:hypothetical protein
MYNSKKTTHDSPNSPDLGGGVTGIGVDEAIMGVGASRGLARERGREREKVSPTRGINSRM